jgi:hypothetical protein
LAFARGAYAFFERVENVRCFAAPQKTLFIGLARLAEFSEFSVEGLAISKAAEGLAVQPAALW